MIKLKWYWWVILALVGIIIILWMTRKSSGKSSKGLLYNFRQELQELIGIKKNPSRLLQPVSPSKASPSRTTRIAHPDFLSQFSKGNQHSKSSFPSQSSYPSQPSYPSQSSYSSKSSYPTPRTESVIDDSYLITTGYDESQPVSYIAPRQDPDYRLVEMPTEDSFCWPQENSVLKTPDLEPPRGFESKGERKCREVLQKLFKRKFPNKRPQWLKNPLTGQALEIDCYCEELNLGVEYQGIQHYRFPNGFHKSKQQFWAQRYRDKQKKKICDQQGVWLIVVPYTVPLVKIRSYIKERLPPQTHFQQLKSEVEVFQLPKL